MQHPRKVIGSTPCVRSARRRDRADWLPVDREAGEAIVDWYPSAARRLPWREPGVEPWAVLVSEVMLQQTPVARVEPVWREWMARWATPAALAAATPAEVIRAWGKLGYPRRALRLREAAVAIVERHGGGGGRGRPPPGGLARDR